MPTYNEPQDNSLDTDLVAYWKLNETEGTRADSVGSLDLTDRNSNVDAVAGKVANAANFEASGGHPGYQSGEELYVDDDSLLTPSGPFTFSVWFRWEGHDTFDSGLIFGKVGDSPDPDPTEEYWLSINSSTEPVIHYLEWNIVTDTGTESVTATTEIQQNTWYHAVVGWNDEDEAFLYLNGELEVSSSITGSIANTGSYFGVGQNQGQGSSGVYMNWNGQIDELGYWSKALTEEEIEYLYNNGNGRSYTDSGFTVAGVVCGGRVEPDYMIPTGGAVCGGEASLEPTIFGDGGVVCGGEASINDIIYAEGGVVVGGDNQFSIGFAVSGGILANSSATQQTTYNSIATGGAVVAGLATHSYSYVITGGIVAGGLSEFPAIYNPTSTGGTVAGDSATAFASFNPAITGGAVVGGESSIGWQFNQEALGGAVVGGDVIQALGWLVEGGAVCGGLSQLAFSFVITGGIEAGGEPDYQANYNPETTGGAVANSSATIQATYNESPTGGAVCNGSALLSTTYIETVSGGAVAGGSNSPGLGWVVTGGVRAGDSATIQVAYHLTPTGGAIICQPFFNNGFNWRRKLTIPAANVSGDHANFPLRISALLDIENVTNGTDFRFETEGGTRLYHELVRYNSSSGRIHAVVKTDLSASVDNVIYLYYGLEV